MFNFADNLELRVQVESRLFEIDIMYALYAGLGVLPNFVFFIWRTFQIDHFLDLA